MIILGIESTCDETSCAIVEDGERILSHVIFSQASLHQQFGGVFPEYASREHAEKLIPCIEETLLRANLPLSAIDAIAVASEPGLMGSLLMGTTCASMLSFSLDLPLIPVNHVEAHLYAAMMGQEKRFPALGLVLSGGHTFAVQIRSLGEYALISSTVDDAIGESFDKVAAMLDLPYPGGPEIEKLAQSGNADAFSFKAGNVKGRPYHFSFSGLKTNVLYTTGAQKELTSQIRADIAASFQKTAIGDIIAKSKKIIEKSPVEAIYVGGGVTMNKHLRSTLPAAFPTLPCFFPHRDLSLDNGAMIAGLAFHKRDKALSPLELNPSPRSELLGLHP